ncbi:MAG: hypothetical protein PHU81_09585 [Acidobacteriota bacterium]|nr:hypothetical protein [Acidobacteriota bacterium]
MINSVIKDKSLANYDFLRDFSINVLQTDLFGVADISSIKDSFLLPAHLIRHYEAAISLGKEVLLSVLDDIEGAPTPLYFHHYRQLNNFLDRAALQLAGKITSRGFLALPIAASQIIDWKEQKAHVSHKKIGRLAGLGWLGRNNLLVNPVLGARFRLVTVLTNMPLKTDQPLPFGCGNCHRCQTACPAQAIKNKPEEFDHLGCYQRLKEFRQSGIVGQFICGVCVKACYGQKKLKASFPGKD